MTELAQRLSEQFGGRRLKDAGKTLREFGRIYLRASRK
jgi:hypothetical protein